MAQDIRELFKDENKLNQQHMPANHELRFAKKLEQALPQRKSRSFPVWQIAASVVLLVSVSVIAVQSFWKAPTQTKQQVVTTTENNQKTNTFTLGNVSPELKKVEDYYMTNINYELSTIQVDDENKQLFDSYMRKLAELNDEYQRLTKELNADGPNQQNVSALVDNLQLRLQLLYQLQEKLEELKNQHNEKMEQKA